MIACYQTRRKEKKFKISTQIITRGVFCSRKSFDKTEAIVSFIGYNIDDSIFLFKSPEHGISCMPGIWCYVVQILHRQNEKQQKALMTTVTLFDWAI